APQAVEVSGIRDDLGIGRRGSVGFCGIRMRTSAVEYLRAAIAGGCSTSDPIGSICRWVDVLQGNSGSNFQVVFGIAAAVKRVGFPHGIVPHSLLARGVRDLDFIPDMGVGPVYGLDHAIQTDLLVVIVDGYNMVRQNGRRSPKQADSDESNS